MSDKFEIAQLLGALDRGDVAAFGSMLTEDARYYQGNDGPSEGRAAIVAGTEAFLGAIGGLEHKILRTWEHDDVVIAQIVTIVTTAAGRRVELPSATITTLDGARASEHRVYIDTSVLAEA